jgi:hypothetical protein
LEPEYILQPHPTVAALGQKFGRYVPALKEPGYERTRQPKKFRGLGWRESVHNYRPLACDF